jgi:hypothetical protein
MVTRLTVPVPSRESGSPPGRQAPPNSVPSDDGPSSEPPSVIGRVLRERRLCCPHPGWLQERIRIVPVLETDSGLRAVRCMVCGHFYVEAT